MKTASDVVNLVEKTANEFTSSNTSNKTSTVKNTERDYCDNPATDKTYFAGLLTEENFPGYTIDRDVSAQVYDPSAHCACYPISYIFKKDGVPVLAVFIIKDSQYTTMPAVGSYNVLDDNNIKYIRFFIGWQNEKSYVLNRVRENLK